MPAKIDITGQKFNRLTVLEYVPSATHNRMVKCLCDCGKTVVVVAAKVKFGSTKSCGCLKSEVTTKRNTKHGMRFTPEYDAWRGAKKRVDGKDREKYVEHGIKMSEEFYNDFLAFYEHIGPRPSDAYSLGRIDNFKGYERGNIRWELIEQQARNHSKQKNNKSGVVGVHKAHQSGKYESYVASATVNGIDKTKTFSISRYGEELAFFLACEQRDQWILINELCFGVQYAPTHGLSKEEYEQK